MKHIINCLVENQPGVLARIVGLISGRVMPTPFRPEENRWRGYRDTLTEAGLPVEADLEACGHFTIDGGERAMTALLARPNPPTAVFAMSDEMAFGALRSLRAHGLEPGRDLSVVGFDGHEMSEHLDLTTVVQPVEEDKPASIAPQLVAPKR